VNLFVSYSRRDGMVTTPMLELLQTHLSGVCTPFIHCLQERSGRWEQWRVMRQLLRSHAILLIESPAVRTSIWVKMELLIARMLFRPVMRLRATDLGA
jgi:hypothetical protein